MKEYVVGFVFNEQLNEVLMLKRSKEPYRNLFNGIGGKVEANECFEDAMNREWKEETGLQDTPEFTFLNTLTFGNGITLHAFYGIYKKEFAPIQVPINSDEGQINWIDIYKENLFNAAHPRMAGEGNIAYFLRYAINVEQEKRLNWILRLTDLLNDEMRAVFSEKGIPIVYEADLLPIVFVHTTQPELLEDIPFVTNVERERVGTLWV